MSYQLKTKDGENYKSQILPMDFPFELSFGDLIYILAFEMNEPRNWTVHHNGKTLNAYNFHSLHINKCDEKEILKNFK